MVRYPARVFPSLGGGRLATLFQCTVWVRGEWRMGCLFLRSTVRLLRRWNVWAVGSRRFVFVVLGADGLSSLTPAVFLDLASSAAVTMLSFHITFFRSHLSSLLLSCPHYIYDSLLITALATVLHMCTSPPGSTQDCANARLTSLPVFFTPFQPTGVLRMLLYTHFDPLLSRFRSWKFLA